MPQLQGIQYTMDDSVVMSILSLTLLRCDICLTLLKCCFDVGNWEEEGESGMGKEKGSSKSFFFYRP